MNLPINFLIIGAQKAGTTALFDALGQHEDIFMPATDEILYFTHDEFHRQGPHYLDAFYRGDGTQSVVGAKDVHALYFPKAAERVQAYNPAIKVIALLRNPIDRAYSAYWFARRTGWEDCTSFDEALDREADRQSSSHREQAELTYLSHGHYCEQLERFVSTLGWPQVRVLLTDQLKSKPQTSLASTCLWLGLSPGGPALDLGRRPNAAGLPRFPVLQRLLRADDSAFKRGVRRWTPASTRHWVGRNLRAPLLAANIKPFSYPPMSEATRDRLRHYFRPHNAALEDLLDRDLNHWT